MAFFDFLKPKPRNFPEPDTSKIATQWGHDVVVEVIYSANNKYRVIISKNTQGNFRISSEYWSLMDFEYNGKGHWEGALGRTLTDTLENARILADQELKAKGDNLPK